MTFSQENSITPLVSVPAIGAMLGIKELFIKREDLHPLGSHKGRSLPIMIQKGIEKGATHFAISSSGNAAKAAVLSVREFQKTDPKITLDIYIGNNIAAEKKKWLLEFQGNGITVTEHTRPLQVLFDAEKKGAYPLRQSTSDDALLGYESLAQELLEIKNLSDVFVPASSGTLAVALGQYMSGVKIHVVQTEAVHPFSDTPTHTEHSIADAIVDKVGLRKSDITEIILKTKGSVIVPNDTTILEAQTLLTKENIEATPNGALALAGLLTVKKQKSPVGDVVCCIVTGK